MEEQSVLDYLKERLSLRRLFQPVDSDQTEQEPANGDGPETPLSAFDAGTRFPWRSLLALVLALLAQMQLEPPSQNWIAGVTLYASATGLLVWGLFMKEWGAFKRQDVVETSIGLTIRVIPLFIFI